MFVRIAGSLFFERRPGPTIFTRLILITRNNLYDTIIFYIIKIKEILRPEDALNSATGQYIKKNMTKYVEKQSTIELLSIF